MLSSALVILPSLPLTPNGKLNRNALPASSPSQHRAAGAPTSQSDNIEADITAVWCEALKLSNVGLRENFFNLGGHSLLMVQVLNRLRETSPKPLSMTDVFRFPTIESLAAHLRTSGAPSSGAERTPDRAQKQAAQRRDRLRSMRGRST